MGSSPGSPEGVKERVADLYRVQLGAFLETGTRLRCPSAAEPAVTVILVLFGRAELTFRCLRSLCETVAAPLEIILVDNASTDDTPALLDRLDGARIIRNAENKNFLLGVNQAARRARGRHLLLLNNDAELLPGALDAALATLLSAPDIGAVVGRIVLLDGSLQEAGSIVWADGSCLGYGRGASPSAGPFMFQRDVDYGSGAFLLTPRELFLERGGFDEDYRPAYYEEVDYCLWLHERGRRVVYEPRATIVHYEFASSRKREDAIRMQVERRAVLVGKHEAALRRQPAPQLERALWARQRPGRGRRILLLDDRVPHAALGAGFPRARRLIETVVAQGHFVTLFPLSQPSEPWDEIYSPEDGIPPTVEVMKGVGPHGLASFLRERQGYYDVVVVSRPHNLGLLRRVADRDALRGAALVYDAEALFVLREIARRRLLGEPCSEAEAAALVREEASLARGADAVLAVSEAERRAFVAAGASPVFVLGHAVDPRPTPRPFALRQGLLFVGAVHRDADPNGDSLRWLASEILPAVRAQSPEAGRLRWAGCGGSPALRRLAGVEALGAVRTLAPLYDAARVFVAPSRYAAGLPLKVYDAAAHGLPCVATSLVAEQLGWRRGVEILVADTAFDLARECLRLHADASLWQSVREAALQRVTEDGSPVRFAATLAEALAVSRTGTAEAARGA
jgi:GT2 family glycosyltransferase